ncbi:MAG: hypothetical protein Q7K13_00675 [Polynucleobacter sp.]|uniref:hypothetical protein n=1 Tax=Polynucleobacter sp. TaxID=2029855 RepID=UPI002725B90F|nr:hypothetical protein [Polynucleobacter sp.]MDO8712986.1 hypothetical protein [Polynucleobacter sp.]
MQKVFTLPPVWDAKKFALRYGLDFMFDFDVIGSELIVHKGELVTDEPPIFDLPDAFVPRSLGVKVHHWPELLGWVGGHKILADEGPVHHECYWIVADDEVALAVLQTYPNMEIVEGQPAYIKDKKELRVWTGTTWKKP